MAIGNSVNDEIKEQLRNMKDKTLKEKFQYFIDYFGKATLVCLFLLIILINLIYNVVSAKEDALHVTFLNAFVDPETDITALTEEFTEYANIDTKEYQVVLETDILIDYKNMDQLSIANIEKMMASTVSGAQDVIITDSTYMENNKDAGMFGDLSELLPADILAKYEDKLIYIDDAEDEKGEYPAAIDVSGADIMESDAYEAYFCILPNAPHLDHAIAFLSFIME